MSTKEKWFTMIGLPTTAVDLQLFSFEKKNPKNPNQPNKQKAEAWTKDTTCEQEDK